MYVSERTRQIAPYVKGYIEQWMRRSGDTMTIAEQCPACPLCGNNKPKIIRAEDILAVECWQCGLSVYVPYEQTHGRWAVVMRWNRRARRGGE